MDSHPSCRRPHKLPAHTFKEPRNRPQRLLPYPDVSVEVSRSFWQPVSVSSTPREEKFPIPSLRGRSRFREVSRTFWQLVSVPSTPREEAVSRTPHPCANAFQVSEPPSIGDFRKTASTS